MGEMYKSSKGINGPKTGQKSVDRLSAIWHFVRIRMHSVLTIISGFANLFWHSFVAVIALNKLRNDFLIWSNLPPCFFDRFSISCWSDWFLSQSDRNKSRANQRAWIWKPALSYLCHDSISPTTVEIFGAVLVESFFEVFIDFVMTWSVTLTWPVFRRPTGTVQYVNRSVIEFTISLAHAWYDATNFIKFKAFKCTLLFDLITLFIDSRWVIYDLGAICRILT